jgi:hypothetical protein
MKLAIIVLAMLPSSALGATVNYWYLGEPATLDASGPYLPPSGPVPRTEGRLTIDYGNGLSGKIISGKGLGGRVKEFSFTRGFVDPQLYNYELAFDKSNNLAAWRIGGKYDNKTRRTISEDIIASDSRGERFFSEYSAINFLSTEIITAPAGRWFKSEVDYLDAKVPLPAGVWMLLAGIGAIAGLRYGGATSKRTDA